MLTVCGFRVIWQFGEQPPTLLASDTSAMVAVPLTAPAVFVSIPTWSALLLVAPGASRLNEPVAVTGPVVGAMLALRAAWGVCGSVSVLVKLRKAVGEGALTRTFPRFTGSGVCALGFAGLMTWPDVWMVPTTPKSADPTWAVPSPLLTPLTAPAVKKLTGIEPFTDPAVEVLTLTLRLLLLVPPATRPAMVPVPLIRLAPVPVAVPKLAFRSSTKPLGPVAIFEMLRVWLTDWPTWTVPKLRLVGLLSWPTAAWNTLPETVMVCGGVRGVLPSPLVPVPLET